MIDPQISPQLKHWIWRSTRSNIQSSLNLLPLLVAHCILRCAGQLECRLAGKLGQSQPNKQIERLSWCTTAPREGGPQNRLSFLSVNLNDCAIFESSLVTVSTRTVLDTFAMSSVLRKLRIIAIPLTRPNVSRTLPLPKTKPSRLVYYQFQLALDPPPSVASEDKDSDPSNTKKTRKGWLPEEGVAKWATNKAVDTWGGFGKEKSGWKVCICSVYWLKRDDGWVLGF